MTDPNIFDRHLEKFDRYMAFVRSLAETGERLEEVVSDKEILDIASKRLGSENIAMLGDVLFAICAQGAGNPS